MNTQAPPTGRDRAQSRPIEAAPACRIYSARTCPGDFGGDGTVDSVDLTIFLCNWGSCD